jgi:hypothetical protein
MPTFISILVGAALVALAILLTNHWDMATPTGSNLTMMRLNRWTGTIEICSFDGVGPSGSFAGAELRCNPK